MNRILPTLAIAVMMILGNIAEAQRPGGGGRGGRGGRGGGQQDRLNQNNFQGNPAAQQFGNQFGNQARGQAGNQNGNRQQPSPAELAAMFIANFDADGNGELNQVELQTALAALQQRMMNRGGGQGGMAGGQAGGFANGQNALQNQAWGAETDGNSIEAKPQEAGVAEEAAAIGEVSCETGNTRWPRKLAHPVAELASSRRSGNEFFESVVALLGEHQGAIQIACQPDNTGTMAWFAQHEATYNGYLNTNSSKLRFNSTNASGTTYPESDDTYSGVAVLTVFSDGTETFMLVGDALSTASVVAGVNDGEWWADIAGDETVIGMALGSAYPADGDLYELHFWDGPIELSDLVKNASKLLAKYS